jgi:hypothetical protein
MNTRAKLTVVAMFSVFALASNPARADVLGFSIALPDVSAVTAEVGKMVAADMTAYLRNALLAPRVMRKHQSPTVTVHEVVEATTMETVTVVATRLAPTIETVTVVASRLPPQATESLAQASMPTRL